MPRFEVIAPDGRTVEITGERVPTKETLDRIFAALPPVRTGPSAGELARPRISDEIDAATEAAAPDETFGKAQMAGAGAMGRALSDPFIGAARLVSRFPLLASTPTGQNVSRVGQLFEPLAETAAAAEEAAAGMKGNETLAEVAGAVGSGVGSAPMAMLPGVGAVASAAGAGLQSYEGTRREALRLVLQAGVDPAQAEDIAHRAALKASIITGGVTAGLNRYGGKLFGKGVERGLSETVKQVTIDELRKSAARPIVLAVAREALGEGAEEATDQLLQESLVRWAYDPSQTLADSARQVLKAGFLGTVAGTAIGGPGAATEVIGNRAAATRRASRGEPTATPPRLATGVPGDTAALETPMDLTPEPEAPQAPERAPGTYLVGKAPDGRDLEVAIPEGGNVETAKAYLARAVPGATVDRIETVSPATEPEPDKDTPAPGNAPGEAGEAGVVAPASVPMPETTNEEVIPREEEGQQEEEVLTQPPAAEPQQPAAELPSAEAPAQPPARKRTNAGLDAIRQARASRPPDVLDWIAENIGTIRSKGGASEANRGNYDNGYDFARAGGNRNLFHRTGMEPDVAAQAAYDARMIPEPTVDALWEAMGQARGGREAYFKSLRRQAADAKEYSDQADRFDRAAQGKRDGRLPKESRTVEEILVDDLMPGDEFKLAGEPVTVSGFDTDPETGEVTGLVLDDGRKFGTQRVAAGTALRVDAGTIDATGRQVEGGAGAGDVQASADAPFSLRQPTDDFFSAPESVADQKARLEREAADRKRRDDRQKMLDRQAAPLTGRSVDTTGDMFDPLAGNAPLFTQAKKSAPAKGPQGELFSTAPKKPSGMTADQVRAALARVFPKLPRRLRISDEAPTYKGRVVEGEMDKPTGVVTLYAPNLRDMDDLFRVLRHEMLHDVYEDPLVREAWNRLRATLDRGARTEAAKGEGYAVAVDEEADIDEVESRVDKKAPAFRRFVQRIIGALYRAGRQDMAGAIFGLDALADVDAKALVGYALRLERMERGGPRITRTPETRSLRASNATVEGPALFSLRAYHGTPHKVDRFSTAKIGTGEGSQVYGWGLYFTENEEVAKSYAESLASGVFTYDGEPIPYRGDVTNEQDAKRTAVQLLSFHLGDLDGALADADDYGDQSKAIKRILRTLDFKKIREGGPAYTVELDADNDQLLDYDASLFDQPDVVQSIVRDRLKKDGYLSDGDSSPTQVASAWDAWLNKRGGIWAKGDSGGSVYAMLAEGVGGKAASEQLLNAGIRGVVYLDEGGIAKRGAQRARGYAIFDDRYIKITEENWKPVTMDEATGKRMSLRSMVDAEEPARRKLAGRAVTPLGSALAYEGARVMGEMGPAPVFTQWSAEMTRLHGDEVRPYLSKAWEDAQSVRYSLGAGIPPEAQADINRITAAAEAAPSRADREPTPVYDPQKTAKLWMLVSKKSAVIRYFGGDDLLRKRQLLDMRTAYQSAAVRQQAENLGRELEDAFYGDKAGPILRFVRQFAPKAKLRRFMKHALPIAAHLNVTGGSPGAWTFADFEQRAGFMPESTADRDGLRPGSSFMRLNPIKGDLETLTLGPKIELESGQKGYQIIRPLPAARQEVIYQWAREQFPEFQWFLDMWMDPRLKDTRVTINGIEVPVFNRHALAGRYAQGDPAFGARPAYTPDVAMGPSLLGTARQYLKQRKVTFREGIKSPGRKYETGTARESGNVLDLLSGFNVRAMQVLQEDVRKQWSQDVLKAAQEIPKEGLPLGWTPIENAMADVWRAVQTMRKFDDPVNFPETTGRLRDDDSPEFKRFFGELMRLRKADAPMMVPEPLVKALVDDYATTAEIGLVGRIARVWARNWKAFLLLMPDTFAENRTDNYLRMLMQAHRQLLLAAFRGGDGLAFREARRLAWAAAVNIIPGVRRMTGLNRDRLFREVVRDTLPDEIFEGGQRLQDLWVEKGSTEEEVGSLLAQGQRVKAAAAIARDLGPLILEKTGYGKMDVAAKQQFAFTTLLARAEHEAARRGLRGDLRDQAVEAYMRKPPEEAVRRAIEGANRLLLNYNDTPGWLSKLVRNPLSNLFVAFPLFRYHFVGRELDRATAALRAAHKMLVRGKKLSRDEWASALADTVSYITLPLMGYSGVKVAGALVDSLLSGAPGGDDDDRDPREIVGASSIFETRDDGTVIRKPLPRELVTANRLNVSAMLRQMGVDTGSEKDYWWHIKDYPLIRSTALMYQAGEDTRRHGPVQGIATLFKGITDLLTSLAGTGQAVKVPEKILLSINDTVTGRTSEPFFDPYSTAVPLDAYLTLQALNLIPAGRQANEVVKWLDPVPRRITRSKLLDYDPGVTEALQAEGWTGLADRIARGAMTGDPSSPLPPQGRIDRRAGVVAEPREFDLASRIAAILGQNIKPVPRAEYDEALRAE